MAATEYMSVQDDRTQEFHHQYAQEDSHQTRPIDWDSDSATRVESLANGFRNEPEHLSDSVDESLRQILHSDFYSNRLDPGLYMYGHTSLANEAGVSPMTMTNLSEDGNYVFRAVVESEEEYSHDEDIIFDVGSEKESTDDERGFDGDDEDSDNDNEDGNDADDSDSRMELSENEDEVGVEQVAEDGEAIYMQDEDSFIEISGRSVFGRNSPPIFWDDEVWEIEWPSEAWQNAFNRTEQN
jgi:hypothetical protein